MSQNILQFLPGAAADSFNRYRDWWLPSYNHLWIMKGTGVVKSNEYSENCVLNIYNYIKHKKLE